MLSLKRLLIKVCEALKITVADYTVTTGTEQYSGQWYYANITLAKPNPSMFYVYVTGSNRPTLVQRASNSILRVYTSMPSAEVTVRVLYFHTAGGVILELIHRFKMACTSLRKGVSVC